MYCGCRTLNFLWGCIDGKNHGDDVRFETNAVIPAVLKDLRSSMMNADQNGTWTKPVNTSGAARPVGMGLIMKNPYRTLFATTVCWDWI